MTTEKEIRINSKSNLYRLLMIQHAVSTGDVEKVVDDYIFEFIANMDSDDVASVKEIAQLKIDSKK